MREVARARGEPVRARRSGCKRMSGPACADTLKKRLRRTRAAARRNVAAVISELLRVRIVARPSLQFCSNVRRSMALQAALRLAGLHREAWTLVVLVDFAARRPALTAQLADRATWAGRRAWCEDAVFDRLRALLRGGLAQWGRSYWHGPSRLNCERLLRRRGLAALRRAAAGLTAAMTDTTCDVPRAVDACGALCGFAGYLSFSAVRLVCCAAGVRALRAEGAAVAMSENVSLLHRVLPLSSCKAMLSVDDCAVCGSMGNMANIYCATTKVLRLSGVLQNISEYQKQRGREAEQLAGPDALTLLLALRRLRPLTDAQLRQGQADAERRATDAAFPDLKRSRHFSSEAENCFALVRRDLRARGVAGC